MGNKASISSSSAAAAVSEATLVQQDDEKAAYRSFPGSAILEKAFCGSIDTTDPTEYQNTTTLQRLVKRADKLCVSSPVSSSGGGMRGFYSDDDDDDETADNSLLRDFQSASPVKRASKKSGVLLARALVNEVTDNPKTMKPAEMAAREYKLLKAQHSAANQNHAAERASNQKNNSNNAYSKPVGASDPPHMLRSMAYACTGDTGTADNLCSAAEQPYEDSSGARSPHALPPASPFRVTLGLCLSRRSSVGNPHTITRQTAYDFNQLQDRQYKYVSSTSTTGWRAGGGESDESETKLPAADNIHIAISVIDCPNQQTVDAVITALASGEIFIPHMQILPERVSSNSNPEEICVNFGCERNDQENPEEWANWCLEFMHNQLYEYFYSAGARWMPRPFSITLATGVRWKTVKHMNRYFSHCEKIIEGWREQGPQYLYPASAAQGSTGGGGATPDEVAHPHGIYLFRNGIPTNYFCPNFEPPYTTKMTRSLLMTVLEKSYDKKRREWSSTVLPRVVEPVTLLTSACGCDGDQSGGFMAKEVTRKSSSPRNSSKKKASPYRIHSEMEFGHDEKENGVGGFEEKKTDDVVERSGGEQQQHHHHDSTSHGSNGKSNKPVVDKRRHSRSASDEHTTTPSVAHASVAESGTTVMHTNVSKQNNFKRSSSSPDSFSNHQYEQQNTNGRLFSDEDFLDQVGNSSKKPTREALVEDKQQNTIHEKKKNNNPTMHHNHPAKQPSTTTDREKAHAGYTMQISPKAQKRTSLEHAASLEYSTDGSSAFFTQDQSLIGQQFAEAKQLQSERQSKMTIEEEEEESMLSLQSTSDSAQSVVPMDEELFAVGWAKALDPNSGNYYYFTLDRTRTVWDNPLSTSESVSVLDDDGNSGEQSATAQQRQQKVQSIDP